MSDYDMCACYDDDETEFYRATEHRARKPYRCDECGGSISAGDRYEKAVGGGRDCGLWTYRTCGPCVDGPLAFVKKNCGCWAHGGDWLYYHLHDVFSEYSFTKPGVKFRVGRMLVGMRRRGAARRVAA